MLHRRITENWTYVGGPDLVEFRIGNQMIDWLASYMLVIEKRGQSADVMPLPFTPEAAQLGQDGAVAHTNRLMAEVRASCTEQEIADATARATAAIYSILAGTMTGHASVLMAGELPPEPEAEA